MINEIVTDSESCWIFTHDTTNLVHTPQLIEGLGVKFGYPSTLTAVCKPTEAEAEAEIIKLNLQDDRN